MYYTFVVILPTSYHIVDPYPKTHINDNYKILTFINNFINIIHMIIFNHISVMLVITHCPSHPYIISGGGAQKAYSWNVVLKFESNTAKSFFNIGGYSPRSKASNRRRLYYSKSVTTHQHPKTDIVTVLAIENRIYITSSVKTSNYIMNSDHENFKDAFQDLRRTVQDQAPVNDCQLCWVRSIAHFLLDSEDSIDGVVWWPHSLKAKKIVLF